MWGRGASYAAKLLLIFFLGSIFELVTALAALVASFETLDASGGVNKLLLACVERMTGGAQLDYHLFRGAAGLEGVAASAGHLDVLVVCRMYLLFHFKNLEFR